MFGRHASSCQLLRANSRSSTRWVYDVAEAQTTGSTGSSSGVAVLALVMNLQSMKGQTLCALNIAWNLSVAVGDVLLPQLGILCPLPDCVMILLP